MASLFKKKTVDGEFQAGPNLCFPVVFWEPLAAILAAVPGGGAGSSSPTGDRPLRHFSASPSRRTAPLQLYLGSLVSSL